MFGEVLSGKSIVRQIESQQTQGDKPSHDCTITDCGELTGNEATKLPHKQPDKTGDAYEDFPDDEKQGEEELTGAQILKIAIDLKGFGNTAFKNQQLKLAIDKYQKGLRYLHENPEQSENDSPNLFKDLDQLKITLHSNSALCSIKLQNFSDANHSASAALEVESITTADKGKALFRRALAKAGVRDEESAIQDLQSAKECAPGDSTIANELKKLREKSAERTQKERAAFKKFFQ